MENAACTLHKVRSVKAVLENSRYWLW